MSEAARLERRDVALVLALAALKVFASWAVLRAGLRQISDDDYARVVIAQTFAQAPKLDPSGSSWLPFPFWLTGSVMTVFGRSLEVARVVAVGASAGAVALLAATLRAVRVSPASTSLTTLCVAFGPWALWSGACPVPEGFVATLVAVGAIGLAHLDRPGVALAGAAALCVAALSRYESWPACALFVLVAAHFARRRGARYAWIAVGLAAAAPVAWMAWNAHAHDGPLHFLGRVARYREAHGEIAATTERLLAAPRALVRANPEAIPLALSALFVGGRARLPLVAGALVLAFLTIGELSGGAPTHHGERAALAVGAAVAVAAALASAGPARGNARSVLYVAAALLWLGQARMLGAYPGRGDADRVSQLARGRALRDGRVATLHVTPCRYEHFALVAAFEAPERVVIAKAAPTPTLGRCPHVEEDAPSP